MTKAEPSDEPNEATFPSAILSAAGLWPDAESARVRTVAGRSIGDRWSPLSATFGRRILVSRNVQLI
jgi:hypothetical protein